MANFHVDSSGNLWLGDTSTTFTTSAPFYVTSAGAINATQVINVYNEDDFDLQFEALTQALAEEDAEG